MRNRRQEIHGQSIVVAVCGVLEPKEVIVLIQIVPFVMQHSE